MKANMENLTQAGSEMLALKINDLNELEQQINALQSKEESLAQRIKEKDELIWECLDFKRIVAWLQRELELGLVNENKRKEYIESLHASTSMEVVRPNELGLQNIDSHSISQVTATPGVGTRMVTD